MVIASGKNSIVYSAVPFGGTWQGSESKRVPQGIKTFAVKQHGEGTRAGSRSLLARLFDHRPVGLECLARHGRSSAGGRECVGARFLHLSDEVCL